MNLKYIIVTIRGRNDSENVQTSNKMAFQVNVTSHCLIHLYLFE